MTTEAQVDRDPFADPTAHDPADFAGGSTLNVGRNASLTLATDSLIVLGVWQTSSSSPRTASS